MAEPEIHPVGSGDVAALRRLFGGARTTRHCRCMAFCSTSWQLTTGWYGGGNQRRFETMLGSEDEPMGLVASVDDDPVGWVACGPRSRYTAAIGGRSALLQMRDRAEDRDVWLIACLYVAPTGVRGLLTELVGSAIALARERGAVAIEAWPTTAGARQRALAHLGSEALFARHGFRRAVEPTGQRVIVRLPLATPGHGLPR